MRKTLLTLFFGCNALFAAAQYVPASNQGYQYMALYNPAFSGIENFGDIKLSYLYQWGNLPEAPKTINMTFNFRLNQPVDLSNSSLRPGSTASYTNPSFIPKRKRIFSGLGGNVFQQTYGPLTIAGGGISYGFHYPLTKNIRLAGGVAGIVENIKVDHGAIEFRNSDDPYAVYLQSKNIKQTNLNVRAGMALYAKNYYVGVSYFPLFNKSIQTTAYSIGDHPFYRGSIQAGYSFPASASLTLKPSMIATLQIDNKVAVDYAVKAYLENKLMIGLAYRDIQSAVFYVGLNINEYLGVNYSYELSVNGFRQFNDGSHELVLQLRLNNFRKANPYLW